MIPGLGQWVEGSRIATAVAQIQSLAQELPYALGAAIKKNRIRKLGGILVNKNTIIALCGDGWLLDLP